MNTSSKTDIATGAQAAAGASRGVVTPTQLTLAAVALLALFFRPPTRGPVAADPTGAEQTLTREHSVAAPH